MTEAAALLDARKKRKVEERASPPPSKRSAPTSSSEPHTFALVEHLRIYKPFLSLLDVFFVFGMRVMSRFRPRSPRRLVVLDVAHLSPEREGGGWRTSREGKGETGQEPKPQPREGERWSQEVRPIRPEGGEVQEEVKRV